MRGTLILALAGAFATTFGAQTPVAAAPEPRKEPLMAVMDIVNNTGEHASFTEGMPDMLITELMATGDVKLVERTKVQTAMKALKLEASGLTEERNLELGKWLGVDGILFGTFNKVGEHYRLDVRAIDVQTGKIKVAASATCGRSNVLDLVPEIGAQLRIKLALAAGGKPVPPAPPAPAAPKFEGDSCSLAIQYKMLVSLLSQAAVPHQRVRIYLDNRLLHVSPVVDRMNKYFLLFKGKVSAGPHTLALVHGVVDKRGRWIRELEDQPDIYTLNLGKGEHATLQYRMHAHDAWLNFQDFKLVHTPIHEGD